MSYFNNYCITPGLGLREEIDLILANECVTGDTLIRRANYEELEAWKLKSLVPTRTNWYMAGYGSTGDTFKLAAHVTSADLKEIIEAVEWLCESPLLSESRYSDLSYELKCEALKELANEHEVDPEVFVDVANERYDEVEVNDDDYHDTIYLSMSDETLNSILDETKRVSQTREAHYGGGQWHVTSVCSYCAEFPELVGSRAE